MQEIEIKVLNINKKQMEKKLTALGAVKKGRFLIVEKNFDFKNKNISKNKCALRLRSVGKRAELTFKSKANARDAFKVREETETMVGDFKTMEKILNNIGLQPVWHRQKYRTSFQNGPVKFEIDEYPGIPPYLEIEGSKKDILKYLRLLGIPQTNTSTQSSTKVLKQYGVNHTYLLF